jgi:hypothetical protein
MVEPLLSMHKTLGFFFVDPQHYKKLFFKKIEQVSISKYLL